jgi:hypothetical protein
VKENFPSFPGSNSNKILLIVDPDVVPKQIPAKEKYGGS